MHALRIAAFNCAGLTNESSLFDLPGNETKLCIVSTYYRQELADSQVQLEITKSLKFLLPFVAAESCYCHCSVLYSWRKA